VSTHKTGYATRLAPKRTQAMAVPSNNASIETIPVAMTSEYYPGYSRAIPSGSRPPATSGEAWRVDADTMRAIELSFVFGRTITGD